MGDIIVIAIVVAAVAYAVHHIRTKKSCTCGNGCDRCHKKPEQK